MIISIQRQNKLNKHLNLMPAVCGANLLPANLKPAKWHAVKKHMDHSSLCEPLIT